jgi:hypothetical protein
VLRAQVFPFDPILFLVMLVEKLGMTRLARGVKMSVGVCRLDFGAAAVAKMLTRKGRSTTHEY